MRLASGEVQSWSVRLDVPSDVCTLLYSTLTDDERDRCARLRFDRHRKRFVVAHGVLRELLGRHLGARPDQVRFVYNAFGKPELSPEFDSRLRFNLSHSADLALIAFTVDACIGVDVERVRPQPDYLDIAQSFFSAAEVEQLNRYPGHLQTHAFFSYWTKKEAYVKACGEGLQVHPKHILVTDRRWSLYTLCPAPGYVGALAVEGTWWRLGHRSLRLGARREEWYVMGNQEDISPSFRSNRPSACPFRQMAICRRANSDSRWGS